MPTTITHSARLVLSFSDTTTGAMLDGARFFAGDQELRPVHKPGGYYIFLGELPEGITIEARVPGYEPLKHIVERGTGPPASLPLKLELMPEPRSCLTLEGSLEGISSVDAVRLEDSSCLIREYDERKRVMTILNPHRLALGRKGYAVVNLNQLTYEPFAIQAHISDTALKTDRRLTGEIISNSPICPLISGLAENGHYLLRVRNVYTISRYIVRWQVNEKSFFQLVDFHNPETMRLTAENG